MTVSFDRQASDFDVRAGLPTDAARHVALALTEMLPTVGGVFLDLGAGTGQIGEHLAKGRAGSLRYLGVDISAPMLAVFQRKLGNGTAPLVRADAGAAWPIAAGSIHLLFLSRAAHLLPLDLLVDEALRVASPQGAVVVLGHVVSQPQSLRAVLRGEMRRLLAEHGVQARQAGKTRHGLAAAFARRGGEALPAQTAACWTVVHSAQEALAAWRAKEGLAGRAVGAAIQQDVLLRLEDWIRRRYGSLDVQQQATERYELAPIRLPKTSNGNPGVKR